MSKSSELTAEVKRVVKEYARPCSRRSIVQLANSVLPFVALWILMVFSLRVSYWLTLALAVVTAGFLVRVFIIFHDCGHGSFLRSRRANQIIGFILGVITLTPHRSWWASHTRHHASTGNLDRKGSGDIWIMTVQEYRQSPFLRKLWYRVYRHPAFLFTVAPLALFALLHRIPDFRQARDEFLSVIWTNLALIALLTTLAFTIGLKTYLLVHGPVLAISSIVGIWLFYVQHNYELAYWKRAPEHDGAAAAIEGSSFYRLPGVLQWFSGNIGFHHIHHLSPRIPNYFLEQCHRNLPELPSVTVLGLRSSLRSLSLRLWDEAGQRMISFGEYKKLKRQGFERSSATG